MNPLYYPNIEILFEIMQLVYNQTTFKKLDNKIVLLLKIDTTVSPNPS